MEMYTAFGAPAILRTAHVVGENLSISIVVNY